MPVAVGARFDPSAVTKVSVIHRGRVIALPTHTAHASSSSARAAWTGVAIFPSAMTGMFSCLASFSINSKSGPGNLRLYSVYPASVGTNLRRVWTFLKGRYIAENEFAGLRFDLRDHVCHAQSVWARTPGCIERNRVCAGIGDLNRVFDGRVMRIRNPGMSNL